MLVVPMKGFVSHQIQGFKLKMLMIFHATDLKGRILKMPIKDSGERTRFETGAVRDMHGGKGRMDLLPWEALVEVSKHCEEGALKYGERNCEKGIPIHSLIDSAFRHLAKYMMGMDDEPHLRAAAWNVLFALYMEIKHPELQDIPTRKKGGENAKGSD